MNKKLIAIAIAAALAPAAAMADSGNVAIYGAAHMSFDSLSDGTDRNNNVSSNSSYLGFKGNEDLGNGLKAIWQMEQQVDMGGTGGTSNSWTSRNSYAGLSGGFGTVLMGIHDTPFKLVGRSADLFSDQIGDSRNLTTGDGWDVRAKNVIAYATPDFSGFSAMAAYSTNTDASVAAADGSSPKAVSVNGMYKSGPMMLGLAYEKHNVANPAVADKDPAAWRLAAGYNFGDFKAVALYQKETNNGFDNTDRRVWGLGGAYNMGATTIKAQYYSASDVGNFDNTGAKMIAVGVDYALSKRTVAYVAYAKTNNEDNNGGFYSASAGGHGDNVGAAVDGTTGVSKDPSGISIGLKHAF